MNVSVFGLGYVGCVSLGCLAQNGHFVIGVDVNPLKVDQINSGKATIVEKDIDAMVGAQRLAGKVRATGDAQEGVLNSDISIICVGTPSSAVGHLDMAALYHVAEDIAQAVKVKKSFHVVAVRSTVIPGAIKNLTEKIEAISRKKRNVDFAVVSNPEFLREGTSVSDYYNPPFTLIGSDNVRAIDIMKELYRDVRAEVIVTDIEVAEMIKFINNAFHALKITFANEVGNICQALNIDSRSVMDIFTKDEKLNISPYYLKPGFAYGGSCLPKDLKALHMLAHDLYVNVPLIENIHKSNENQIQRVVELIESKKKKKIGVLGFSFKLGTDDLRNSPVVRVVETLLGKGYEIKLYDKNVNYSILTGKNKEYVDMHIPHLSKLMVKDIREVVVNSDLIIVAHNEKEYIEALTANEMLGKTIIDLADVSDDVTEKGNYFGCNW